MRMAFDLEDGLGLDGDRCMRDTPTDTTAQTQHICLEFPTFSLKLNLILLFLKEFLKSSWMTHVLFLFLAVGCPDMKAPPGGWVKRDGESLTIGCDNTDNKYHLVCKENDWSDLTRTVQQVSMAECTATPCRKITHF